MTKPFQHWFACLVHESRACVADLLENLRVLNPDSRIVLYDGGSDRTLLRGFSAPDAGILVYPKPTPQRWGRLHGFAVDCLEYILSTGPCDAVTIVDSDQLCIRPGYATVLSHYLRATSNVGFLGTTSAEEPMNMPSMPAFSAFDEVALWRRFLTRYPRGLSLFPQWTFWPGSVFTAEAARRVVHLFRNDAEFRALFAQSRIWATEEVVLPTLVALLGFRVLRNPCDTSFLKFRVKYGTADVVQALEQEGVYWMHPVARREADPVRVYIRARCVEASPANTRLG